MGKMMGVSGLPGSYMNNFMLYTVYHYEWPLQASDCFVGSNLDNTQNMCICMWLQDLEVISAVFLYTK